MVNCELYRDCVNYSKKYEVCDKLHTREMLKHPDKCNYKKEIKNV